MHKFHAIQFFIAFVMAHRYLGYWVLFFAMFFEGELFLTAAGILAQLKAFDLFDSFIFAFVGALTGDVLWYLAGFYLKTKYPNNRFIVAIEKRVTKVLPNIKNNPFHVIFLSKFLYGLNHSTILILGFLKVDFKHFFKIQFLATLLWSLIFLTVGYIFGFAALSLSHRLDKFLLITVICIIALILVERIIRRIVEKRENLK